MRDGTRAALAGALFVVGLGIAPRLTDAAPADLHPWRCELIHADGSSSCGPTPAPQSVVPHGQTPAPIIGVPLTGGS